MTDATPLSSPVATPTSPHVHIGGKGIYRAPRAPVKRNESFEVQVPHTTPIVHTTTPREGQSSRTAPVQSFIAQKTPISHAAAQDMATFFAEDNDAIQDEESYEEELSESDEEEVLPETVVESRPPEIKTSQPAIVSTPAPAPNTKPAAKRSRAKQTMPVTPIAYGQESSAAPAAPQKRSRAKAVASATSSENVQEKKPRKRMTELDRLANNGTFLSEPETWVRESIPRVVEDEEVAAASTTAPRKKRSRPTSSSETQDAAPSRAKKPKLQEHKDIVADFLSYEKMVQQGNAGLAVAQHALVLAEASCLANPSLIPEIHEMINNFVQRLVVTATSFPQE